MKQIAKQPITSQACRSEAVSVQKGEEKRVIRSQSRGFQSTKPCKENITREYIFCVEQKPLLMCRGQRSDWTNGFGQRKLLLKCWDSKRKTLLLFCSVHHWKCDSTNFLFLPPHYSWYPPNSKNCLNECQGCSLNCSPRNGPKFRPRQLFLSEFCVVETIEASVKLKVSNCAKFTSPKLSNNHKTLYVVSR